MTSVAQTTILNAEGRQNVYYRHTTSQQTCTFLRCHMSSLSLTRNQQGISYARVAQHGGTLTASYAMDNIQRQQHRTRMKLIDFDKFEAVIAADEEAKDEIIDDGVVVVKKKKRYQEKKQRNREKLAAEERSKYTFRYDIWENAIRGLLDQETYPVGFTNTADNSIIASWCQQVSHTLQQTLSLNAAMSLELVLQLLDRLFQEQEAHIPGSPTGVQVLMSTDISSSAIESALKSWKFSLQYPPFYEQMSVEQVRRAQERVEYYGKFLAKHEDSMLAQILALLDEDRIVHTKTKSTDRLLWGHIPYTVHPNAKANETKLYWGYADATETEIDLADPDPDDS
jgi:hypothetical protein